MNKLRPINKMQLLIIVAKIVFSLSVDPPSHLQKLEQSYEAILNESCQAVLPHIPVLPANDTESFMQAYRNFTGAAGEDEKPVVNAALALLSLPAMDKFLSLPQSFVPGGYDYHLVRCKVLNESTPLGLAKFAVQGPIEETLVKQMLGDAILMRDMLVAGGASGGKFGEAMDIFIKILNTTEDSSDMKSTPSTVQCGTAPLGHNNSCIHNPWGVLSGFPKGSSSPKECCNLCHDADGCLSWTFYGHTCNAFRYIDQRSKLNQGSCVSGGQLPGPPAPPPPAPSPAPPTPRPKPPKPPAHPWDDRSQANILRRLALGTALEFAVPMKHMMVDTYIDPVQR